MVTVTGRRTDWDRRPTSLPRWYAAPTTTACRVMSGNGPTRRRVVILVGTIPGLGPHFSDQLAVFGIVPHSHRRHG